jgi:hypothetical protein
MYPDTDANFVGWVLWSERANLKKRI